MSFVENSVKRTKLVAELLKECGDIRVYAGSALSRATGTLNPVHHLVAHVKSIGILLVLVSDVQKFRIVAGADAEFNLSGKVWMTRQVSLFKELSDIVYNFRDVIQKNIGGAFPVPFTGVVAFPESAFISARFPPAFPRESFLLAEDFQSVDHLKKAVYASLDYRRLNLPERKISILLDDRLKEVLENVLGDNCSDDGFDRTGLLTKAQVEVFCKAAESRLAVAGVAGSGKTLLATAIAKKWGAAGGKSVYVCRNRLLKYWIRSENQGAPFEVLTPDDLADIIRDGSVEAANLVAYGHSIRQSDFPEMSEESSLIAMSGYAKGIWDCMVVDEAQDFSSQALAVMEKTVRAGGLFHIYFDADQFGGGRSNDQVLVPDFKSLILEENCRNTRKINKLAIKVARLFGESEPRSVSWAREGEKPILNTEMVTETIVTIVSGWLNEGISPCSIALLTIGSRDKSVLMSLDQIPGHGARNAVKLIGDKGCDSAIPLNDWLEDLGIFWTTAKAFKGLEAKCVLVCDIPSNRTNDDHKSLFVAITRATDRIAIILNDLGEFANFSVDND
jgi:hypothetical protein